MKHEQLQEHATQRYFLDEMSEAERNEFEEHYFDCAICAAEVRDAARLLAVGREIAREQQAAPAPVTEIRKFRPWVTWYPRLATAAAAVFAIVIGWQTVTIQSLRTLAPRGGVSTRYEVTTSKTRGIVGASPLQTIRVGEIATVEVEILPPPERPASYVISIRDGAGRVKQSDDVSLEQAEESVPVVLPALPRGSYQLVIEGVRKDGNRFEITRHGFEVVSER